MSKWQQRKLSNPHELLGKTRVSTEMAAEKQGNQNLAKLSIAQEIKKLLKKTSVSAEISPAAK